MHRFRAFAPDVRERVLHEAAGNPLALVELPSALRSMRVEGTAVLSAPLPLTARLAQAFAARAVELPPATRTALLVAAANDGDDLAVVLRAAGAVHRGVMPADVLEPAIAGRLIEINEAWLSFRHPLVRSAIYGAASVPERHAAHAALAEALADQPDRRVWHRAASSIGSDAAVAAELEAAAARARRRGATAVALAALERAAKLSDDPALRGGRLLRAGEMAFELGGPDLGMRFAREAEPLELSPMERARLSLLRELFEHEGLWAEAARVGSFVEIVDRVRLNGDADLALNLLLAVAQRCWWANLEQETRDLVVAAAERMSVPADNATLIAILAFADPIERGAAVIDRISRLQLGAGLDSGAIRLIGAAATAVGAFDHSPGFLAASVDGLRVQGALYGSVFCQNALQQPTSEPSAAGPGPGVGPVIDSGFVQPSPGQSAPPTGNGGTATALEADGFNWTDAGIGAAIGFGVALLAGGAMVTARRRNRLAAA